MRNRFVGYIIIAISILFLIVVFSFNSALESIVTGSCTHGDSCPIQVTLFTQQVISYGLVGIIALVGIVISFLLKDEKPVIFKEADKVLDLTQTAKESKDEKKAALLERIKKLDKEEQTVMNKILVDEGSIYQSDLVKNTNYSKVKITRILDKLEGKGFIERHRRGMTNIVILKE